jgi:hypothetical protein
VEWNGSGGGEEVQLHFLLPLYLLHTPVTHTILSIIVYLSVPGNLLGLLDP